MKGGNDLEMYIDSTLWRDPDVLLVADKLQAYVVDDEAHPQGARVEIRLKDGRRLEGAQEDARATETDPFSDEVMEQKFRRLTTTLPAENVDRILRMVAQMEEMKNLSELVPLLQKAPAA